MIFVFGSNLLGIHGAGSALEARKRGFPSGLGVGYHSASQCYAFPTCFRPGQPLDTRKITHYAAQLLEFAKMHPEIQFQLTRVGCGYAGFDDMTMACMFLSAPPNILFDTQWAPFLSDSAHFWGTFK